MKSEYNWYDARTKILCLMLKQIEVEQGKHRQKKVYATKDAEGKKILSFSYPKITNNHYWFNLCNDRPNKLLSCYLSTDELLDKLKISITPLLRHLKALQEDGLITKIKYSGGVGARKTAWRFSDSGWYDIAQKYPKILLQVSEAMRNRLIKADTFTGTVEKILADPRFEKVEISVNPNLTDSQLKLVLEKKLLKFFKLALIEIQKSIRSDLTDVKGSLETSKIEIFFLGKKMFYKRVTFYFSDGTGVSIDNSIEKPFVIR